MIHSHIKFYTIFTYRIHSYCEYEKSNQQRAKGGTNVL